MEYVDLLRRLAERPVMYVGKRSIERIDAFLCGYAVCAYDHSIEIDGRNEYDEFLERKYTGGRRQRWSEILRENSESEEAAFALFVETLNEFMDETRGAK